MQPRLEDSSDSLFGMCRKLSAVAAPSGNEDRLTASVVEHLQIGGLEPVVDRLAQVAVEFGPTGHGPTVMVSAHLDELGLTVRAIDSDGMLRVHRLGGVPERVLPGTRLIVHTRMLPGSSILRKVNRVTKTPIESAIAVGVVAIGINFLSAGLIGRIAGFSSVMLYATYGSTVLGILIGDYRRKIPEGDPGYFSLGRWLRPMCFVFVGWAIIVIICLIAPTANRVIGLYVLGFELAGVLWYLLVLRRRLRTGRAGPHGLTEAADHL